MKVETFSIFFVLLFNCYSISSAGIASDFWLKGLKDVAKFLEMQKDKLQNDSINNRNKLELNDVTTDCLFLILEQMDLDDLVNMAETNRNLAFFATDVFRRKYSKKTIVIEEYFEDVMVPKSSGILSSRRGLFSPFGSSNNEATGRISYVNSNSEIKIHDVKLFVRTMRNFGNSIQRLKVIYNDAATVQSNKITKFINKYCADSLIELELNNCTDKVFKFMPKPFKILEQLTFSHIFKVYYWEIVLPMNEQFPQLRRLAFELSDWGGSYHYYNLPQLEHLKWHVSSQYVNIIRDIVIPNRQIRSIDLGSPRIEDLKTINKYLNNLESITISQFPFEYDPIHFENVTKLNVEDNRFYPSIFTFSNLQELSMNCYGEQCERWIQFLEKHNSLKRFHIGYSNMNDDQFERLMNLPNLSELKISRLESEPIDDSDLQSKTLKIETVIKCMKTHEKLVKFSLGTCKPSEKIDLQQIFQNEWKIIDFNDCLSFERRN